ncbi:MAG: hypothetical protein IKT82_04910, partial [Bacteroidaceae bacterium]|nr:hypothetical protein [Bacteroidaceae bacterium]
ISLRLKAIQETMPRRLINTIEISEEMAQEEKVKVNYTAGETILYKGKRYQIEEVNESTGKVCINRGTFAGYAWLYPEEISKIEE